MAKTVTRYMLRTGDGYIAIPADHPTDRDATLRWLNNNVHPQVGQSWDGYDDIFDKDVSIHVTLDEARSALAKNPSTVGRSAMPRSFRVVPALRITSYWIDEMIYAGDDDMSDDEIIDLNDYDCFDDLVIASSDFADGTYVRLDNDLGSYNTYIWHGGRWTADPDNHYSDNL